MVQAKSTGPTDSTVRRSSRNVFAALGLPDADGHLIKAELVSHIDAIARQRSITRTEATRFPGLSQPNISRPFRGDFREYSLERLLCLLTMLGRDIDIVSRQPRSPAGGKLRVAATQAA